jgi:hypothetical protein
MWHLGMLIVLNSGTWGSVDTGGGFSLKFLFLNLKTISTKEETIAFSLLEGISFTKKDSIQTTEEIKHHT